MTYFATANHTKSMPDMEKWAKAMLFIARNEQNVSENNVGLICDFFNVFYRMFLNVATVFLDLSPLLRNKKHLGMSQKGIQK